MFGSREVSNKSLQAEGGIANRINKSTVLEGELKCETDIRIEGKIKGIIHCKAKVIIGISGEFEGDVTCAEASIEGKVIGRVEVNGTLFLRKTCRLEGEVIYKKLVVEEGATIIGSLSMGAMKSVSNTKENNSNFKSNNKSNIEKEG